MNFDFDMKDPAYKFFEQFIGIAKNARVKMAIFSSLKNKNWDGGSLFILYTEKDCDKFDVVRQIVESLGEDENEN